MGTLKTIAPLAAVLTVLISSQAHAIGECHGGDRAARKVTCIVDGDTGWERGVKWRMKGIDAPEISHPQCKAEKRKGNSATARLIELMSRGYKIEDGGDKGKYGRDLVRVILKDGRDAGKVLISEGLAQPWPNTGNIWCGR